jgi:hypothetical protein
MESKFPSRKSWLHRLDQAAADLNIVLLLFAIGLAMLDLTLLVTPLLVHQLRPLTQSFTADVSTPIPNGADQAF